MACDMVPGQRNSLMISSFHRWMPSRTEPAYHVSDNEEVIKIGATTINVSGSVGYAIPDEFRRLIAGIFKNVPSSKKWRLLASIVIMIWVMATANSSASGKEWRPAGGMPINGIGERAGNAALEEIVMAIKPAAISLSNYRNRHDPDFIKTSRLVRR